MQSWKTIIYVCSQDQIHHDFDYTRYVADTRPHLESVSIYPRMHGFPGDRVPQNSLGGKTTLDIQRSCSRRCVVL